MRLLAFLSVLNICNGANILVMLPFSPKSHVSAFMPVFEKLVERGHNISMVTNYREMEPRANWTLVNFKGQFEKSMKSVMKNMNPDDIKKQIEALNKINKYKFLPNLWSFYLKMYEEMLEEGVIQQLLDESTKFDLMIAEAHYLQELFIVFGYIYEVPVINIESHFPPVCSCYFTGNVCPSFSIPNYKSSFSDQMTFIEKIQNTLLNLEDLLGANFYYIPQQEYLLRKYFKHPKVENLPPLESLLKNVSLTLIDSHFSQSYARPFVQNIIEVGGLTINSNTTLDEELDKYMNESAHGVIYFSFGSSMPIEIFPKNIINAFVTAFNHIKQNVIMKWDGKIYNKPGNVKLVKWVPQNSILAHPKCLLFISHGGIHSLTESIYHGTPLLLVPQVSDQEFNSKFAEINGFAYVLNKDEISPERILDGIREVISNPIYKENILKRASILKDKPMSPLETAVYWVEYVLRHKGASHLKPASIDLNVFEYILLDIGFELLFSLIVFIILVYFFIYITKKTLFK